MDVTELSHEYTNFRPKTFPHRTLWLLSTHGSRFSVVSIFILSGIVTFLVTLTCLQVGTAVPKTRRGKAEHLLSLNLFNRTTVFN